MINFTPKQIRAICFDMDGTLLDSKAFIARFYHSSLQLLKHRYHLSFPIPEEEEISRLVGERSYKIFEICTSMPAQGSLYEYFRAQNTTALIGGILRGEASLMPKVQETWAFLREKKIFLGIASNASMDYLQNILHQNQLIVDIPLVSLGEKFPSKTAILKHYQTSLHLQNTEILVVGDRIFDIQAALGNEIPSILLSQGLNKKETQLEGEGASLILQDIPSFLQWCQVNF